jgi:hypothetical protein
MQQKLQTILFFTFLICVQISYINSLKIKSQIKIKSSQPTNAPAIHHHQATTTQDLANNLANLSNNNEEEAQHRNQFHIHHIVPRNLTNTNNLLRNKINHAHSELGQIDDLQKETLEARLFNRYPRKPAGIMSAAIINAKKGEIAEQSNRFNIQSIKDLSEAISEANIQKERTVTVDGSTYKLTKIGLNFFYGAIVGHGGIGAYLKDGYIVVMTHNNFISFNDFTYFFGQVLREIEGHEGEARFRFFKDNFEDKKASLESRLKGDKAQYNAETQ